MTTTAEMELQLAELRELRAEGVRRAQFGEDHVEYRSDAELAAAIADLEYRLSLLTKPTARIIYPRVSKGY